MEKIKVTLCPNCGECPSVEIGDEGVSIGEGPNTARLSHAEWNDLVTRIRSGELKEV
jgi:sarcosine oxidase delta subunit